MLANINLNYTYIYILRFIFLYRSQTVINCFNIFFINKIILFFSVKATDNFNKASFYNYYYLIKFFFGLRAFFTAYKSMFNLGVTTYNLNIMTVVRRRDIYNVLFFFINDIILYMRRDFEFFFNITKFNKASSLFILKDMSIFPNKKTNIGLFNLSDSLYLKMFYAGCNNKIILFFKTFIIYF